MLPCHIETKDDDDKEEEKEKEDVGRYTSSCF